jgi:ornithine--oxo-acid transaminase
VAMLRTGEFQEASTRLGAYLLSALRGANLATVEEIRGRGLWAGIQLVEAARPARRSAERLLEKGVLAKDTHESTLRLAPPLVISQEELEWGLERILPVLRNAATV